MNKYITILIFSMFIFSFIPFTEIVKSSDTQYEYYTPSPDAYRTVYGAIWGFQTFTVGNTGANQDFYVTSIKVNGYRVGSVGTLTAHIRNIVSGKPSNIDLCSGNIGSLSTSSEWKEITMNISTIKLSANTQYALVINSDGTGVSNSWRWNYLNVGAYSGGNGGYSSNSGSTFTNTSWDGLFYIYGLVANRQPTINLQFPTNSSTAISLKPTLKIWANDSDLNTLTVTWQTNYSGSYVTKQVNTSFTANTTCRWYFSDCTTQFKKYYCRVYVNDGTVNISKWFCFTTVLYFMNIKYSNICYANNSIVNYTYNFTVLSDRLDNFHKYLNLSFTKNTTEGFNTTTKLYFDKTLLNTWTFINGTKKIDIFDTIPFLYNGTKYTWSINTTYYNLSYNISYNFTFEILFDNLNLTGGNGSFDPNSTGVWLYLGAMLTLDNGQFFLLILIGLWSYFIYLFYKEKEVIFSFCIICCGLPLGIILSGVAYYNSYPFGYLISFIVILISFLISTYAIYKKNKKKN